MHDTYCASGQIGHYDSQAEAEAACAADSSCGYIYDSGCDDHLLAVIYLGKMAPMKTRTEVEAYAKQHNIEEYLTKAVNEAIAAGSRHGRLDLVHVVKGSDEQDAVRKHEFI